MYVLLAIVLSGPRSVYAHLGNASLYIRLWLLIGVAYNIIIIIIIHSLRHKTAHKNIKIARPKQKSST